LIGVECECFVALALDYYTGGITVVLPRSSSRQMGTVVNN